MEELVATSKTATTGEDILCAATITFFKDRSKEPEVILTGEWKGSLLERARRFLNKGYRLRRKALARELEAKAKLNEKENGDD